MVAAEPFRQHTAVKVYCAWAFGAICLIDVQIENRLNRQHFLYNGSTANSPVSKFARRCAFAARLMA